MEITVKKLYEPEETPHVHQRHIKNASTEFKGVFLKYGYGVVAFFTLLSTLQWIMFFISVFIAIPQILGFIILPL